MRVSAFQSAITGLHFETRDLIAFGPCAICGWPEVRLQFLPCILRIPSDRTRRPLRYFPLPSTAHRLLLSLCLQWLVRGLFLVYVAFADKNVAESVVILLPVSTCQYEGQAGCSSTLCD